MAFSDLRESTPDKCVPLEKVEKMAWEWKMADYFEISALSNDGLDTAFKQCVRCVAFAFTYVAL